MLKNDNRDYIYLVWKEPITRRNYVVGELSKNGQYEFKYGYEINEAIEKGFEPLISFQDINRTYKRDTLFPTFTSRLPDRKRRGLEKILLKYGLKEYDAYKLLKRSGARLPIDNIEFIDPIPEESEEDIKRVFYVAGSRHYIDCKNNFCQTTINVQVGEELRLQLDVENEYDKYAIKILDTNSNILGYIPRYYSKNLSNYIKNNSNYTCKLLEFNKDKVCNECMKVELIVHVKNKNKLIS